MEEMYLRGAVITASNLLIFLTIGTAWILLVG